MKNINTHVLGIIGGMGPYTDGEFISLLRRQTNAVSDLEHIPLILDGNCARPDRTEFIYGNGKSPLPSLISSLQKLQACGADVIAMPCNTAHFFISELKRSARPSVKVIDMTDEVCRFCALRGYKTVTVLATLGTHNAGIYSKRLAEYGISEVTQIREQIEEIQRKIQLIKSGKAESVRYAIEKALRVSDAVIIGCTELSLSVLNDPYFKKEELRTRIADSLSILASSCIKACERGVTV